MLMDYLTQKARLNRALRNPDGSVVMDARGQIQYEDAVVVDCRKQHEVKEIITPDKQTIKITDTYYLADPILEADELDGKRVRLVREWRDLDSVIGYKAVV